MTTQTTLPKHTTKTTPELQIGDVVWAHGVRLRLTKINIDAEKARSLAESRRSLAQYHARSDRDRYHAETVYLDDLTLRNFSVEFVGYLPGAVCDFSPQWWEKNYNVQGNHFATWAVEVEG